MSRGATHVDLHTLADHLEGQLDDERAQEVARHVDRCPVCAERVEALQGVTRLLAAEPAEPMPDSVADRISAAVRAEQSGETPSEPKVAVLADRHVRSRRVSRPARVLLVAAAAVAVVAVGGTVAQQIRLGDGADEMSTAGGAGEQSAESGGTGDPETASGRVGAAEGAPGEQSSDQEPTGEVAPRHQSPPDLITEVFTTRTVAPLRERAGCVAAALDDPDWTGTSYSVRVGGEPAAVAFIGVDPAAGPATAQTPVTGVLVRCEPTPEVVERRVLR